MGAWQQLTFGTGELLIFIATLLWAVENIIAKRALRQLSSLLVASARMILGSALLLVAVIAQGGLAILGNLSFYQLGWTVLAAVLLLGYVISWYAALQRAPATVVASLLVPASLVTSLLSLIFLDKALTATEILSSVIVVFAVVALVWGGRRLTRAAGYVEAKNY